MHMYIGHFFNSLYPSFIYNFMLSFPSALFTAIEYLSTALSEHFLQKDQFNQQVTFL